MDEIHVLMSVQIALGSDSDPEELDSVSMGLRRELLELDVDSVTRAPNEEDPPFAKASGTGISDMLIVSLSNSTVLVSAIHLLGWWVKRETRRRVTVKIGGKSIEIDSASVEETAKLIESWVNWHGPEQ